ncbi:MAG: GNAT family N-acetyltransferase [Chloroflexi bacterium]|nr:GNAT family N-acetyltransferase [Chloroflexota bacterium]
MIPITRLQSYLRHNARQQYDVVPVPPFTLFFHPSDPLAYFNYAIPDGPTSGQDLHEPLTTLRATFAVRDRQSRFEFIQEFAPHLAPALCAAGFVQEACQQLMICTPETYCPTPDVITGLTITTLTDSSPTTDVQAFLTTQRQGFNPNDATQATEQEAERFLQELCGGAAFLARLDGQPAGVAMLTPPFDAITEAVGIATHESFRRKGVASALTAQAVRVAFDQGVKVVCLTAADERAGRLYERAGFYPYATMLACIDERIK